VLVFLSLYLTGSGSYIEMLLPNVLVALLIPAIGAAYGVFFFHWMFESERAAPYADYGVFIWLVSAVVSLFYSVIALGLVYALVQSLQQILEAQTSDPAAPATGIVAALAFAVTTPLWYGLEVVVEFFKPNASLDIALWFPLSMICCWLGKRAGMRARQRAEAGS
jgi:hypothetical protein